MNPEVLVDKDRNVIPRWRKSWRSLPVVELKSVAGLEPIEEDYSSGYAERVGEWERRKSIGAAADLISFAFVHGIADEMTKSVAAWVEKSGVRSDALRTVAEAVSGTGSGDVGAEEYSLAAVSTDESIKSQLMYLKRRVQFNPRDGFCWIDMARLYAMLGQARQAARAAEIAVILLPDSRFVLRSAARLWVHLDEPDRAVQVLESSEVIQGDPWILAAHIAACNSMKKRSPLIKSSFKLIERRKFDSSQTTELESALGTAELQFGSQLKARNLLRSSLVAPSENSIAQASWAVRKFNIALLEQLEAVRSQQLYSHEASAWEAYRASNYDSCVNHARDWFLDQPFSRRPAEAGSQAAWLAGNVKDAVLFSRLGHRANPNAVMIRNNLVYYHLILGEVDEASKVAEGVVESNMTVVQRATWHATSGLLAWRKGDGARGRKSYREVIQWSLDEGYFSVAATATLNYAAELRRSLDEQAKTVSVRGRELAAEHPSKGSEAALRYLESVEAEVSDSELTGSDVTGAG